MFAQDCIDSSIPFIRLSDTAGYSLELMQEYKTDNLAIVKDGLFLGILTENFLMESDDLIKIEALQEHFIQQKTAEGTHLFDVLKKGVEYATYHLPVVSAEDEYIGITTPQKILNTLGMYSSLTTSGGIIVLELETKDYSLTEISKIVESNNAMILHSMVATSSTQHHMQVCLKINRNDLKEIQATFERYQYSVLFVLHQSEYEMQLKDRYDSLMKYLEA